MQISFIIPAEEDTLFSKDAFKNTIGQLTIINGQSGVIDNAVVDENGTSVEITITISDPIIIAQLR